MTARTLICACEDVTDQDVAAAIGAGNRDLESLKRFTGLATGICQGRSCLARAAALLAASSPPGHALIPTTQRPPLLPVRLGVLAKAANLPPIFPGPDRPILYPPVMPAPPPDNLPPLPREARIVIIGGGIMGLATAYHLSALGESRVVVLERGYLNAGASGRNGGGIRATYATERNVDLMVEAMALCKSFARDLGINIWLRQGGYLFLARQAEQMEAFARHATMHNQRGVPTRLLTPAACKKIVPHLNLDGVVGAAFNPDDGVIFPWPFLWGYATRARQQGVHVATFTAATGIETHGGRVAQVHTARGSIRCELVINAAAAWSGEVAAFLGVALPNRPERHEILVTESLKPFLDPLVSDMHTSLYFSQSMRGEIVAGMGERGQPPGVEMRSSLRFAMRAARALCERLPALAQVQLIRQWAGCYDITPDGNPVLGEVDEVRGFFQLNGFMGHGFMMAPAVCKRLAAFLVAGKADTIFDAYRPQRFTQTPLTDLPKETMIIG